jgi:hypothetical protein
LYNYPVSVNINKANLNPVVDTLQMKALLGNTSDKRGKIARMIHSGDLLQLRRGLYATRRDLNPLCLAAGGSTLLRRVFGSFSRAQRSPF